MPRNERTYSVFVASPSDVSEERDRLETIVGELNAAHARSTGVRLELLRWERDVSPDFGSDPQAVINEQIPQDYDIFIGIFWNRIGGRTKRAESGAVEEFNLAKARHDADPDSVRLMLYFKDMPPDTMDDFDVDQYKSVVDFCKRVSAEGCFYKKFQTPDDFANQVRLHLTKIIQDLRVETGGTSSEKPDVTGDHANTTTNDEAAREFDDGIFELEDLFEEEMMALEAVLGRMTEAIADMGSNTKERTQDLDSLKPTADVKNLSRQEKQKLRADTKRVLKHSATDMDRFIDRMKPELPLFRQHLDRGVDAFTRAVPLYVELDQESTEWKVTIGGMLEAMEYAITNTEAMHKAVHGLPPLTAALVRSKKETSRLLREVIDIMRGGKASLEGVLSLLP